MVFQLHIPCYPLNEFVESFYYYRDFNPVHSIDRFLPDGNINLVFDLTDYPKYIYHNETLKEIQACKNVWFSGMRNKYISIPSGKESEMFIVNFHKGKAYPFTEMPLNEFTDSVVDAELALTPEILNLRDHILNSDTIVGKFACAEQYLLKHYHKKLNENPFITYAVKKILHMPGTQTIEQISAGVGYSQKHLIKLFKEHVGVTPKAFMRITRFQKAIQEIETTKQINWSRLALESGYYDQAHFINDFRDFSGFTPRQYMAQKNDQLNYVPVG